jgi:hypothetical protein
MESSVEWNEVGYELEEAGFEWKDPQFTKRSGIMCRLCTKKAGVRMYYGTCEITRYKPGICVKYRDERNLVLVDWRITMR